MHSTMTHIHVVPQAHATSGHDRIARHSTMREGTLLGLAVGTATWLWIAGFDLIAGEPFQTFNFLGGIWTFTLIHFALCVAYGVTIMTAIHASVGEPTLVFAIIFCAILFQAAAGMATAMLANIGIGNLAWGKFFAGNAIAAVLTVVLISRDHPLRQLFHAAEEHLKD